MAHLNWTKYHTNQLPKMTCQFIFDENEPASYCAGDTVRGHLHLNVSKLFHTWCVEVALEGTAVVKLGDSKFQSKSETFFRTSVNVYGRGERIAFAAGDHKFPFALKISPKSGELPGSMRSTYGFVLYQLVATLQQELRSFKQAEKVVEVQGFFNLSKQEPSLMTPVMYEKLEKYSMLPSFLCKRTGSKFKINLCLKRSGFLLGEGIPVEVKMNNPDAYEICGASVTLIKKLVFYVDGQNQKVSFSEVQGVETRALTCIWMYEIPIPVEDMIPTQKGIIEVSYYLRVKVNSNSADSPFILEAPVMIGTTK